MKNGEAVGGSRVGLLADICCKSRLGTPLTKQWNQNYGSGESKLRFCSLRRFNLARQDPQNTFATQSDVKRTNAENNRMA
jgi:hypothetical protein